MALSLAEFGRLMRLSTALFPLFHTPGFHLTGQVPMAGLEPAGMDHAFRRGFTVGCGRGEDAGSMPVDGF
jgi:hypothetical protein